MAAKKKHSQESASETLDQLESTGDRIVDWVGRNPLIVLGSAFALLAIAGVYGFSSHRAESARERSSGELAQVQDEFRSAMGAGTDTVDIPEPANPETGREVRTRYAIRFDELAQTYSGSTTGALAALEAARLQEQLGRHEDAIKTLVAASAALPAQAPVHAFLLSEVAGLHEAAGAWGEAAKAYRAAFEIESNPLRWQALANAARCLLEAGEAQQALEIYVRMRTEAADYRLPAPLEARLQELEQASRAS